MPSSKPAARPLRWHQWTALVVAGLLSFALSAYWSGPYSSDTEDLVLPVVRAPGAQGEKSAAEVQAPRASAMEPTMPILHASSVAMTSAIQRDPFGRLNLGAEAELQPGSADRPAPPKPRAIPAKAQVKPPPPPPPPAPVVVTPPPPPSPALPFTVVGAIKGRQIAEGRPVAFLKFRDEVVVVRAGDEIDRTYKVEEITKDKIVFLHIPSGQRKTLANSR